MMQDRDPERVTVTKLVVAIRTNACPSPPIGPCHGPGREPHTANSGGQIGDVPAPQLVRAVRPEARLCPRCLRWSCPTPPLALSCLVQDPIKTGLRADVVALIGQCWHDLPRCQRGVFRLIAGEHDSLTFLLA